MDRVVRWTLLSVVGFLSFFVATWGVVTAEILAGTTSSSSARLVALEGEYEVSEEEPESGSTLHTEIPNHWPITIAFFGVAGIGASMLCWQLFAKRSRQDQPIRPSL